MIGALAVGKRADIVVLDDTNPDLCGVSGDRWLDAATFVAGNSAIARVYVGGRQVVESGRHLKRGDITERYRRVVKRLAGL